MLFFHYQNGAKTSWKFGSSKEIFRDLPSGVIFISASGDERSHLETLIPSLPKFPCYTVREIVIYPNPWKDLILLNLFMTKELYTSSREIF